MYSDHYQSLSAPGDAEGFARALGEICVQTGAERFLSLRLTGVSRRTVAQHFHNGDPATKVMLSNSQGRLEIDRFLVKLYANPVPSMPIEPGVLELEGFEHGAAALMRGERHACVVVFAGSEPVETLIEMLAAASISAQCALEWFATIPNKACPLSERELQCLRYYTASFDAVQTGAALGISANTVNGHLGRARLRCGVESTLGAAMMAISEGWIQPSEVRQLAAVG